MDFTALTMTPASLSVSVNWSSEPAFTVLGLSLSRRQESLM